MIFITGDTHGLHDFAKLAVFARGHAEITKNDYMIICGDFGGVWTKETLRDTLQKYDDLPFTTLFADGNHENYALLSEYPESELFGGKVQIITPSVIRLMRGQIFTIEGKTFFVFGGATSTDADMRVEGVSVFKEELPSQSEFNEAMINLEKAHNKVDFIVTHSCDERALFYPPLVRRTTKRGVYPENLMLSCFEDKVTYSHWYFGHYHLDGDLTDKKTVLYNTIRRLV